MSGGDDAGDVVPAEDKHPFTIPYHPEVVVSRRKFNQLLPEEEHSYFTEFAAVNTMEQVFDIRRAFNDWDSFSAILFSMNSREAPWTPRTVVPDVTINCELIMLDVLGKCMFMCWTGDRHFTFEVLKAAPSTMRLTTNLYDHKRYAGGHMGVQRKLLCIYMVMHLLEIEEFRLCYQDLDCVHISVFGIPKMFPHIRHDPWNPQEADRAKQEAISKSAQSPDTILSAFGFYVDEADRGKELCMPRYRPSKDPNDLLFDALA